MLSLVQAFDRDRLRALLLVGWLFLLASCAGPLRNTAPACEKIGQTWVSPADGMTLVCVPKGEFTQGAAIDDPLADPDEKPQHAVYLDAFWMDRTEVTNAMFAACVAAGACHERDISPYLWGVALPSGTPYYGEERFLDYPAILLDSDEAQAYCRWVGRRLPSEAEWEKAARGVDQRPYPWGNAVDCERANFLGCLRQPAPAAAYLQSASPYGVLNMAGNLWEWTADWYDPAYYAYAPGQNPPGPDQGEYRTLRGGGWRSLSYQLRLTNRASGKPEHSTDGEIGFRCATSATSGLPPVPIIRSPGQIVAVKDAYGVFYAYLPTTASSHPNIVVLVHGTPPQGTTAEENARYYLANWVDFAEAHGCLLLAPAFTQEDFSSVVGDHALGGYRGLFGRLIAADAWVLRLVDAHQQAYGTPGARFYLYGHSAGGQFTARFLVTHPGRIERAVITSAATYPQPDLRVAWPFGMGELHTDIAWDADTVRRADVIPDQSLWLAATQRPLTVIVGLMDTSELPAYPGPKGTDRYTIAKYWVDDMATFAAQNDLISQIEFDAIPGIGHTMTGLLPYSQAALMEK